jgi:hypothetical protein
LSRRTCIVCSAVTGVNSAFVSRVQTQAMLFCCNGVEISLKERA